MYARTRTSSSTNAIMSRESLTALASSASIVLSVVTGAVAATPVVRVERRTRGAAFATDGSVLVAIAALRRGFGAAVSVASLAAALAEVFVRAEAFAGAFADDFAFPFLGVSSGAGGTGRGSE